LAGMDDGGTEGLTDANDVPDAPAVPVSKLGDVWLLGKHRLMCGDSTSIEAVNKLTGGIVPDIANCDPPYGINAVKGGTVGGAKPFGSCGGGMTRFGHEHGRSKNAIIEPNLYAPIIGDESTDTAVASYHTLVAVGVPIIALWGGNYFASALPDSRCWLVWDKETNGNFADAELAWTNQDRVVELFRHQWSGLIKASERGERRCHPTQKPVALAVWVIEALAPDAKTVIDLFGGSGSTLMACEALKKQCFMMEFSPDYCDVIITRWQQFTGKQATLEATGEPFPEATQPIATHASNISATA